MNARKLGLTQTASSTIAEISERTGQRIEGDHHRTNRGAVIEVAPRPDVLAEVRASELEPMLRREPRLKPTTLFEYLQVAHPGEYQQVLRTLQRRVREWKALHGPEPEVMFMLRHEPGVMGLSDFTKLKGMEITLNGESFEHLIYHYRLAQGRQEEAASLILRMLTKRFGSLAGDVQAAVTALSIENLEALSEALLDFDGLSELGEWIGQRTQ